MNLVALIGNSVHFVRILRFFHVGHVENVVESAVKYWESFEEIFVESFRVKDWDFEEDLVLEELFGTPVDENEALFGFKDSLLFVKEDMVNFFFN